MASLNTHLQERAHHARLAFRADCPICRDERLQGEPASDALLSARVPAALAAGVLALSSSAPVTALAAEPGRQHEGSAAPQAPGGSDGAQRPDFEPGGPATSLPDDTSSPPPSPNPTTDTDDGPPERESDAAAPEPLADDGDDAAQIEAASVPANPAPQSVAAPVETQAAAGPAATLAPAVPAAPMVIAPVAPPPARAAAPERPPRLARDIHAPRVVQRVHRVFEQAARVHRASQGGVGRRVISAVASASHTVRGGASRWHVVRPGESLWTIAAAVLELNAASEDAAVQAAIGREVDRLWRLNSKRVGTGNPSLILAGQRLRLR